MGRRLVARLRVSVGLRDSETKLARDAQQYWDHTDTEHVAGFAHWRGRGLVAEERWLAMGRRHRDLCRDAVIRSGGSWPPARLLEWGCGGGSNLVTLADEVPELIGVDVSQSTLEECARQLGGTSANFTPVEIDVADPGRVVEQVAPVDVLLCAYVMEVLPDEEYGCRLLGHFAELLLPGGVAVVQIKYRDRTSWRNRSRPASYALDPAGMTTYTLPQFWSAATDAGLDPLYLTLVPVDELNHSGNYGYFVLQRPAAP